MGAYSGSVAAASGPVAVVDMESPPDLATRTRLRRRLELFAGSTHLRITDTLTNVGLVAQEWGLHDFLQLKGYRTRSGVLRGDETPDGTLGLYVPVNPKSRFPDGVRHVLAEAASTDLARGQWSTSQLPGLLTMRYRRDFSKVLVDPALPWVAFVDHEAGYVFVQRCEVPEKAILTAGVPISEYPFIEIQCLGPVARLLPAGETTLVQDWYAARCPGPVVDVTAAGVVSSPLSLLRREGKTYVAGTFGAFYVGSAALVLRRGGGGELARMDCGPIDPLRTVVLDRAVEIPPGTAEVALEVCDTAGTPLGSLGKILLGARKD
jgi:hypothetical protein